MDRRELGLRRFVAESNRIEGITRPPTRLETEELARFVRLESVAIEDLVRFVSVHQPGARLRDRAGLDVRVGLYYPPPGGPVVRDELARLLGWANRRELSAWELHIRYETLHPFTDGNGRSGRALWAWQYGPEQAFSLGFLHRFYYETLERC